MAARQPTGTHHDLAEGVGEVIPSKGYARIVAGKRTLAYANERKVGVQLDFRASDLAGAPARLRKRTTIKRARALLVVNDKNLAAARALLEHVAHKEAS